MGMRPFEAEFWTVPRIAGAFGLILLAAALVHFSDLTAYLIVSIGLSFVGRPLVRLADRIHLFGKPIGSTVGAAFTLALMFAAFSLLLSLFAPLVAAEANVLSNLDFNSIAQELRTFGSDLAPFLLSDVESPLAWIDTSTLGSGLTTLLGPEGLGGALSQALSAAGNLVVAVFSVSFMTFFFLKDRQLFPSILKAFTPDDQF